VDVDLSMPKLCGIDYAEILEFGRTRIYGTWSWFIWLIEFYRSVKKVKAAVCLHVYERSL